MYSRHMHTPVADLLTGELHLLHFSAGSRLLDSATVAGELHGNSTGGTGSWMTLIIADMPTTGKSLPTHRPT